jgi:hypothetical protein
MRLAAFVAQMGKVRYKYRMLVRKPEFRDQWKIEEEM